MDPEQVKARKVGTQSEVTKGQEEDLGLEMLELGLMPGACLSLSPSGCRAPSDQEGQDPPISQQNLWPRPPKPRTQSQ